MAERSQLESLLVPLVGTDRPLQYVSLEKAEALGLCKASRLPLILRILCESALRHASDLSAINLSGLTDSPRRGDLEFEPARLLLQDFTGIPLMTDLASLRDAVARLGSDPRRVNPRSN